MSKHILYESAVHQLLVSFQGLVEGHASDPELTRSLRALIDSFRISDLGNGMMRISWSYPNPGTCEVSYRSAKFYVRDDRHEPVEDGNRGLFRDLALEVLSKAGLTPALTPEVRVSPKNGADSGGLRIALNFLLPPALLNLLLFFVRFSLENVQAHVVRSYWSDYSPALLAKIFELNPWWTLWLPNREIQGGFWTPTGWVLVHYLERLSSPAITFVFVNSLVIWTTYILSYALLRSRAFSTTASLCLGFGAFHYSTYHLTGCMISTLVLLYAITNLFCAVRILTSAIVRKRWYVLYLLTLIMTALTYESWLDYLVFSGFFFGTLFLVGRRCNWPQLASRSLRLGTISALFGATYLVVRGLAMIDSPGVHSLGSEADMVLTYSSSLLRVEDVVQNLFVYPFMSVSNFLPQFLVGSMALEHLSPQEIIAGQAGYHPGFEMYVWMNYVFLWRFVAGAVVAFLLVALFHLGKRLWMASRELRPSWQEFLLFFGCLLLLLGSPTHSLVKFRPFLAIPIWGYKHVLSIFGFVMLLSYGAFWLSRRITKPQLKALLLAVLWIGLLGTSLSKPEYYESMSRRMKMCYSCPFPKPLSALKTLFLD